MFKWRCRRWQRPGRVRQGEHGAMIIAETHMDLRYKRWGAPWEQRLPGTRESTFAEMAVTPGPADLELLSL